MWRGGCTEGVDSVGGRESGRVSSTHRHVPQVSYVWTRSEGVGADHERATRGGDCPLTAAAAAAAAEAAVLAGGTVRST